MLFSGEAMEKTLLEEKELMLRCTSRATRQKAVEIGAKVRALRAERSFTTGLRLKSEVVNGPRDGPVWW